MSNDTNWTMQLSGPHIDFKSTSLYSPIKKSCSNKPRILLPKPLCSQSWEFLSPVNVIYHHHGNISWDKFAPKNSKHRGNLVGKYFLKKVFLINVGSRRKPESLFQAEPTAGIFYLPSTHSRLVLQETIFNYVLSPRTRCQSETQPQPGSIPDRPHRSPTC